MSAGPIPALCPDGPGHRFVLAADACSGVHGAPHEAAHARINGMLGRLEPPPEFVLFPGDEIIGLSDDAAVLAQQWDHWCRVEMAWTRAAGIPVWNTTGNHTAWDAASQRIMARALDHIDWKGPGLNHVQRHGDLGIVCIDTLVPELGGEGHADTGWLDRALDELGDLRWKLVAGHHPAFAVNGYAGAPGRTLMPDCAARLWQVLRRHRVTAYLCSHILAFDVQARGGVLQITSGGAGTIHRMPEGIEYLHAVDIAIDAAGLRYQVLDESGTVRERLAWPFALPPRTEWTLLPPGRRAALLTGRQPAAILALGFEGDLKIGGPVPQVLLSGVPGEGIAPLLIYAAGDPARLMVALVPAPGRSPHLWTGPELHPGPFDFQLAFHCGMGPGGILWRPADDAPWSTMDHTAAWGAERLDWPGEWQVGADPSGARPFRGDLSVHAALA